MDGGGSAEVGAAVGEACSGGDVGDTGESGGAAVDVRAGESGGMGERSRKCSKLPTCEMRYMRYGSG